MGVPIHSPFVSVEMVKIILLSGSISNVFIRKWRMSGVQLDPTTGLPILHPPAVLFLARALQRFELWVCYLDVHSKESA